MTPEPVPANVQQEPPPFLATVDFSAPEKKRTRAKGKIPALPKAQRDLINHLLDDGATYKTVEIEMAKLGVSLNAENISNWFNGGYQDYLLHQEWLAQMAALRENASDLPCDPAADFKFHQAVLNLAVTQIFTTLKSDKLKDQPGPSCVSKPSRITLTLCLSALVALRQYQGPM